MCHTPYISKSKFLQGLQCPKLLWSAYNAKHLFPEVDAALQAVFDQGHEVGALAKRMAAMRHCALVSNVSCTGKLSSGPTLHSCSSR
jgi:hypothetical protein